MFCLLSRSLWLRGGRLAQVLSFANTWSCLDTFSIQSIYNFIIQFLWLHVGVVHTQWIYCTSSCERDRLLLLFHEFSSIFFSFSSLSELRTTRCTVSCTDSQETQDDVPDIGAHKKLRDSFRHWTWTSLIIQTFLNAHWICKASRLIDTGDFSLNCVVCSWYFFYKQYMYHTVRSTMQ